MKTLILDIDCQRVKPQLVLKLLNLPKLKHFGRLFNVDGTFWRLIPRTYFKNITTIHIGRIQYPNSEPVIENPKFLPDLGFGIKWAFLNIKQINIYLGYARIDTDNLLQLLKLMKVGIPSNENKSITNVNFYQVFDWNLIDSRGWKYVSEQYCGYRIKVTVNDGIEFDFKTSKCFG